MKDEDAPEPDLALEPESPESVAAPEVGPTWHKLLSANELDRHDALLALLGAEQQDFLSTLPTLAPAEQHQLLEALWLQVDVLLIEGRDKARAVIALAVGRAQDPALRSVWMQLVAFYRPADAAAPLDPGLVTAALAEATEAYGRALARALLVHPNAGVRKVARAAIEISDYWYVIASRSTSPQVLLEMCRALRGRAGDDVFKIFLSSIADRLLGSLPREQLSWALKVFGALLEIEAFAERTYSQLMLRIDKNLKAQAQLLGIDLAKNPEYEPRVQAFAAKPIAPEQPIHAWSTMPLAAQRVLARRGLFLRHFCCHVVDAIALECLPHLLRRSEVIDFLKLTTINNRLMALLAEEKQLFDSDAAKFFLLANPRCPYHIIGKYMGYLTSESLNKLAQGFLYNTFARKQAERLLAQRGKAKKQ